MATTAIKARGFAQLKRYGIKRLREEWANVTADEIDAGMDWYPEAHRWVQNLAEHHNKTVAQVAAIAAVLSPRLPWHRAIMLTEHILMGIDIRDKALGRQVRKAEQVLAGVDPYTVVSGPKVTSFFHNLMGEYDWITIDKWAFDQVSGRDYNDNGAHFLERVGVYEMYAECFRIVARENGLEGATLQAILWIHTRGSA